MSALERLLTDNVRFDLGNRGTVNHLPMALVAMSRMGAGDDRLIEYFRWWEDNRALPRSESGRKVDDWQQHIGDAAMFAGCCAFAHIATGSSTNDRIDVDEEEYRSDAMAVAMSAIGADAEIGRA